MGSKLLLPVLLAIFVFFFHPFDGNADFFHHVNTGRYIVQHRSLPYIDEFSHTAPGSPYIAHSWASGLIFYLVFTYIGETGISFLIAFLAVITFILLYKLLKSYGVSIKTSILSLILAVPLISQRFPQRPESFSFPLMASFLLIDKLKEKYKNLPLLFPLLTLFWANLYGSGSILALVLITCFTLKEITSDRFRILASKKLFYLSCLICFPTAYINGYGLKSLLYFYFFIPKVAQYEGEWLGIIEILRYFPLNSLISYQYQIIIFVLFFVLFLSVVITGFKKALSYKFLLILSISVIAPFFALRQIPIAVILSLPLFAKILDLQTGFKKKILITLTIMITVFLLIISLWNSPPGFKNNISLSQKSFFEFIKNNNLSGKAFNHTHMGSLLTYHFYPDILVFYDTRDEVYLETEALKDLYRIYSSGADILPILEKYQIDLVTGDLITDNMNYKDLFYSNDWAVVFLDDRYFIAVPRLFARQKQLKILDFTDPYSPYGVKNGFEEEAVKYYGSLDHNSFNNQILAANSLIFLEKYSEAIEVLKLLNAGFGPYSALFSKDKDYLLAWAYLKNNQCGEAKKYLDRVESEIKGVLVFNPGYKLSSPLSKGYAFYYLKCGGDTQKANEYLNVYLSQKDINPLEKIRTRQEFDQASHIK